MVMQVISGEDPLATPRARPPLGFPFDQLAKWALTTPVQFVVAMGAQFHRGALAALRRGGANMDVLVSLATTASYGYSVLSILHHHLLEHHATNARKHAPLTAQQRIRRPQRVSLAVSVTLLEPSKGYHQYSNLHHSQCSGLSADEHFLERRNAHLFHPPRQIP